MPFEKGKSGNPGGRPKLDFSTAAIRDLARKHAPAAIEQLVKIANSGTSESARVAAINSLLDRGYGKPSQPLDGDGEGGAIKLDHVVEVRLVRSKEPT